jgi:tetratricopeptide (TPR) repeat protein
MRRPLIVLLVPLLLAVPVLADGSPASSNGEAPMARRTQAQVRADRLDALFALLHQTDNRDDARRVETDIWALWSSSDSPTAEMLLLQASRAMEAGETQPSLEILNRLIGAYPDFAEAWNRRATLYFEMGLYAQSLADIDHVLDLEPRHFGALAGRGMIYQREKNYDAALAAFKEALAINPNMEGVKAAVKELEKTEQKI